MLLLLVRIELRGHHGATVLVAESTSSSGATGDHVHVLHALAGRDATRMMRGMLMRSRLLLLLLVLEGMCNVWHRRCHHLVQPETLLPLGIPDEIVADHRLLGWELLQPIRTWTGRGCRKIRMGDVATQRWMLLLRRWHPVGHRAGLCGQQ